MVAGPQGETSAPPRSVTTHLTTTTPHTTLNPTMHIYPLAILPLAVASARTDAPPTKRVAIIGSSAPPLP
jgi:hypothetical protein